MGKQSGKNLGFGKRKMANRFNTGKKSRRLEEENVAHSPASTSSGELANEESNGVVSEEEAVYKEPSMYDKLLMTLGSSSKSVSAAYKLRKRQEEGISDSENSEDDGSESSSDSEDADNDEEGIEEHSEDSENEDDQETSAFDDEETHDSDAEQDLGTSSQSAVEPSMCLSSFDIHWGHKLTKAEVENLSKKKWTYEWEVPAVGMTKGNWAGTGECFTKDDDPNSCYGLKQKLYKHWLDVYCRSGGNDFHSSRERLFFSLFNSYRDILHCNKKPFYHRGSTEDSNVMDAYIMQCLNHVFKTRDLVTKNDAKVSKLRETANNEIPTDDSFLDHGFTRPKVLILLPMASIALRVVKRIIQLTPSAHKVNVEHMDRFSREFGTDDNEDEKEITPPGQEILKPHKSSKPSDFQVLFGGNSKDDFMVGIKFTKRSIKLYSDFYTSDIIVASSVGLLKKIDEAKLNKEKDVDYLSSMEVLVIDHADVITMQNWDFLKSVVEQLNKKVLVILDNILESIDLQSVGLPCLPTCRILLTSRTRKSLSSEKRLQKDFELQFLNEEEAWSLFEAKAGGVVKNPAIRTVATQVAKKCRGWPLLVVTVASSLRNRSTLPVWNDALRYLEVFDNEDSAEQEAYSVLKWSYNQLDDQKLKPLFLICGILVRLGGSYTSLTSLLKYTFGLGFFKNIDSVEHAQNALHTRIEELKDFCLLLDSEDNTSITMHDLLRDVAISIASEDQRALLRVKGDDLKEWPNNEEFSENCTMISLSCENIPRLPEVLKCQQLELFHLEHDGGLLEIPGNFFVEMKKLKVMDLNNANFSSLPQSLHLLQNLQTLCLDHCVLEDITLVGQLSQLEILSFICSQFEVLPEEIGKLTRLRLLDLSGCSQLEVISPNVISRLTSLEDLRMKESFNGWVPEGVSGERSNASLSELKDLPHLAALSIHVPDAGSIPTDLFAGKLKRYQILIGASLAWYNVDETLNTLRLKLPTGCELDHGLEMLLKRSCEDLYLDGSEGADNIVYHSGSEDFQQLKHLHVENNAQFTHIITEEVVLPNLTSLEVCCCTGLTFVLSSSMARNLVQLKKLEITKCESMEEMVSTKEYGEGKTDVMFCKLQHLELGDLPELSRFCSASCNVQFPSLESLEIRNCEKLKGFVFDPRSETEEVYLLFDDKVVLPNLTSLVVDDCTCLTFVLSSSMARNLVQLQELEITWCKSLEEIVSTKEYGEEKTYAMFCKLQHLKLRELPKLSRFCSASCNVQFPSLEGLEIENCEELKGFVFDPKLETKEVYFLFDDKVGFPKLEKLSIHELSISTTVWHNKLDPDSFYKLRDVDVHRCGRLISIITPSIAGRLNALRSLSISGCDRLEVVFESKETPDTSTTQLKMSGCENLDSVSIGWYGKLKYMFPCSVARGLQQLRHLRVTSCKGMKEIVSKEEGLEMMPKFVFPKATNIEFINLDQLKSFYPGIHAAEWPLLKRVEVRECGKLDIFVSKISSFQKHELDGLDTPIKHSLFLIDKDVSFPNLETMALDRDMEIRCGPSTSQLFRKLKSLTFARGQKVSLFENNVNASFPHISVLKLYEMRKLMYLRNENFPGAGPVFSNLEVLQVVVCPELKDIGSSAIPFQNLTTLEVYGCHSLKYLATYTIAKTLKRLREMVVGNCERMTEIGATTSDGDDAGNDGEISFCQLQSLQLYLLPSLQDFFSGNCIVKFPSLKTVNIYKCPKLKINSSEWKSSPELQGVQLTEKHPQYYMWRWESW